MYAWMIQWLNNGVGEPTEESVSLVEDSDLRVTADGCVGGLDIYQIIRTTPVTHGSLDEMLNVVRQLIQYTANTSSATLGSTIDSGSYITQPFTYSPEAGVTLQAEFLIPKSPNIKPAAVYMETAGLGSPGAVQLAQGGSIVLDTLPRGLPRTDRGGLPGEWIEAELSWLIGRNLPGMRAKDILQGLDILLARSDVDPTNVSLYANGVFGITALLATAVDNRIGSLFIDRTPYSFQHHGIWAENRIGIAAGSYRECNRSQATAERLTGPGSRFRGSASLYLRWRKSPACGGAARGRRSGLGPALSDSQDPQCRRSSDRGVSKSCAAEDAQRLRDA
jgi:hypothetical protein